MRKSMNNLFVNVKKLFAFIFLFTVCVITCAIYLPEMKVLAAPPVLMSIDTPAPESTETSNFSVSGWALTTAGIKSIDVYIDSVKQGQATSGVLRRDVSAAFPGYAESDYSGYTYLVNTTNICSGAHKVKVEVTDIDNYSIDYSIPIFIKKPSPAICVDNSGRLVKGKAMINGWSVDVSGVSRVSIDIDGQYAGDATTGGNRPDVGNIFSSYVGSSSSGFNFDYSNYIAQLNPGPHRIVIKSYGNDGDIATSEVTVTKPETLICIDTPISNTTETDNFVVSGWDLTAAGTKNIDIYIDGVKQGQASIGLLRNDVNKVYPGYAEGSYSGFTFMVNTTNLNTGVHAIKLKLYDDGGNSYESSVLICIKKPSPAICVDNSGRLVKGKAMINGWSVDVSGVSRVSIDIDGQYAGDATTGGNRPDVGNIFSSYVGSFSSGFNFDYSNYIAQLNPGPHRIVIKSYGNDGDIATSEVTVTKPETLICIDTPISNTTETDNFVVSGWDLTAAGTKNIDVYIDGVKQGQALIGLLRNDVSKVYPNYAEDSNSGFLYSADLNAIKSGKHTIQLLVTDYGNAVFQAQTHINKPAPAISIDNVTSLTKDNASIRGWAVNVSGISHISVEIDSTYIGDANLGGIRDDVASIYPKYVGARTSGYSFDLGKYCSQFSDGIHTITITAYGNDGETIAAKAQIVKPKIIYSIDSPSYNNSYYSMVSIRGWVLSACGAQQINVYVDGNLLGNATTGLYRPDVNQVFPGYDEGDYSGYAYSIDLHSIGFGPHSVYIVINSGNETLKSDAITFINNGSIKYSNYAISLNTMSSKNSVSQSLIDPNTIISIDNDGIFEFMSLKWVEGITVDNLAQMLRGEGILDGYAEAFFNASFSNNINPIYFIAHTFLESGHGTSTLANGMFITKGYHTDSHGDTFYVAQDNTYYNLFGIHAYDNSDSAITRNDAAIYAAYKNWNSVDAAIYGAAEWISENYINTKTLYYSSSSTAHDQDTIYKMKWDPEGTIISINTQTNHRYEYATSTTWAHTIADIIREYSSLFYGTKLVFDIPSYIS